jgi:hypothetical protein
VQFERRTEASASARLLRPDTDESFEQRRKIASGEGGGKAAGQGECSITSHAPDTERGGARVPGVLGCEASATAPRRYSSATRAVCANERTYGSVRGVPGNRYPYRDRPQPKAHTLRNDVCATRACRLTATCARLEARMESLFLSCRALSSPTICRFIPALLCPRFFPVFLFPKQERWQGAGSRQPQVFIADARHALVKGG